MRHLFAYGTLMCDDIMAEVSGLQTAAFPAILMGYSRLCVTGEHFPAIVADAKSSVEGFVYMDIPLSAWTRLDQFEGKMYLRQQVMIYPPKGPAISAETYAIHPDFSHCLGQVEWDPSAFLRDGKDYFCRNFRGYRTLV